MPRKNVDPITIKIKTKVIKAIELTSKASQKKPSFSVSIQNGFFSLMGIKLFSVPSLN